MRQIRWLLILLLVADLGLFRAASDVAAAEISLEDLQYRVSLGPWNDVARVHLRLTQVEPGRYRAEFAGAAQGAWQLLNRWLPERYEAEMAMEGGRLKPLVYREVFMYKGKHIRKEYRFDYARGVLEVWRSVDHREMEKKWQAPLQERVYDPLTMFYNLRLDAFGPLGGGETIKVTLISDPKPLEMTINIGPETSQGHKVMLQVKVKGDSAAESCTYFAFCSQGVPQLAWMRVFSIGKLSGHLLNPDEVMKRGLPELSRLSLKSREAK